MAEKNILKRIFRTLIHLPVGAATVFLFFFSAHMAWIFFISFLIYELNEDFHIKDNAWKDLAGFMWGIVITAGLIRWL